MKKVITVRFEGEGPENCYDLKQWDRGVTLRIEGLSLPEKVEVHFALDNSEMAQVYMGTTEDGVTTVKVPAFILENADGIACVSGGKYKAFAYIYQSDEESGWTVRKIIFHIEARQRPEDYIHTEEDLKTWEKLEKRIVEVQHEIPKKVSELDNDEGYLTEESDPTVPGWAKKKAPDKSFTKEGEAADAKAVGDELSKKLTSPQTAKVGQIFRVHAVNEDGTLTVEAVYMPSGGAVDDVQINEESIVGENRIAKIPQGGYMLPGVFAISGVPQTYGIDYKVYEGKKYLVLVGSTNEQIDNRSGYANINPGNLDYALQAVIGAPIGDGMIDGVFHYPAWSDETQAAARKRIGIGDYELVEEINVDSDCVIDRYIDLNGVNYDFKKMYISIQFPSTAKSGMLYIKYYRESNYYIYDKMLSAFAISNTIGSNKTFRGEVIVNDIFAFMNGIGGYTSVGIYNDSHMAEPGSGETNTIKSVRIGESSSLIPSESIVRIYGVRA